MIKEKITTVQLFFILFISRILVSFTRVPTLSIGELTTDLFVTTPVSFLIIAVMMLPLFVLYKRNKEITVLQSAAEVSVGFSKAAAVLYFLIFLYNASTAISRFVLFSTSCLQPQLPSVMFALIIVPAVAYIAWLGLEALGRALFIIVLVTCVGTGFIFLGVLPRIDALNFEPLFYDGARSVWENILFNIIQTVELPALGLLASKASGKIVKGFFFWILGVIAFLYVVAFSVVGTMGGFSENQLFPFYTVAVMSGISVFKRLDIFQTAIWLCGVVVKASYLMILCSECLTHIAPKKKYSCFIPVSAVLLLFACLVIQNDIRVYTAATNYIINLIGIVTLTVIVPIIIIVCRKLRKRRSVV